MPKFSRIFRIAVLSSLFGLGSLSCKTSEDAKNGSDLQFAQGLGGATHGHEKLTELAVYMANDALHPTNIKRIVGIRRLLPTSWFPKSREQFYPEDQVLQPAYRNTHPLTWGSLSADFPPTSRNILLSTAAMKPDRDTSGEKITKLNFLLCAHYNLIDEKATNIDAAVRAKIKQCDGMPNSPDYQDVHFLRKWSEGTPVKFDTAKQACLGAQDRIRQATVKALKAWDVANMDDPEEGVDRLRYNKFTALYFLGLATHTIQDAFSGAHIDRDPANPKNIRRICHYNDGVIKADSHKEICRHKVPFDPRDIVWKGSEAGSLTVSRFVTGAMTRYFNRMGGDFDNLTPEGQGAVMATMSYLITIAKMLSDTPGEGPRVNFTGTPQQLKVVEDALSKFFNFDGDPGEDHMLMGAGYINCNRIAEQI